MSVQNFWAPGARFNYIDKTLIAADLLDPNNLVMRITSTDNPGMIIEITKEGAKTSYGSYFNYSNSFSKGIHEVHITRNGNKEIIIVEDPHDNGKMRKIVEQKADNESYKKMASSLTKFCRVASAVSGIALAFLFNRHTAPLSPATVFIVSLAGALASELLTTYFRMKEYDAARSIIQKYFKVLNYALKTPPAQNSTRQLPLNYPDLIQVK